MATAAKPDELAAHAVARPVGPVRDVELAVGAALDDA